MTGDKNIFIQNIYHMLSYAFKELRKNNFTSVAKEKFDNIQDLLAELLFRAVSHQLKQGLHRSYIEITDDISTLRGKLNLAETLKLRAKCIQKINCQFDEFSVNNLLNQILVTTLKILSKHSSTKSERKTKIKKLLPYFSDIETIDLKQVRWDCVTFDRNSRNYQLIIYICYFLFNDYLFSNEKGIYKHVAVSDTQIMSRLFEKFVLEFYRYHYPELKPAPRQIDWNINKEESSALSILPILQTDTMLNFPERTLIIDTKFYGETLQSKFEKKTLHSNNQNQIFTYVMNHDSTDSGKTDGMLLYAKTQEEIQPDGYITYPKGNRTYYKTLDLYQDFTKIKAQLDRIVEMYNN